MTAPAHTVLLDETERQRVFRACLEALSRPGSWHPLRVTRHRADHLPLLALTDLMAPIAALGNDPQTERSIQQLADLTRAPITSTERARWLLTGPDPEPALLSGVPRGTDEEPQLGAMIVLPLADRPGHRYRLTGPGIKGRAIVELALAPELVRARASALTGYPRGFDLLCVTGDHRVLGLPRTTRITEEPR